MTSEARWRGFWPSVRQTEQNEQCLGQPRTVCTEAIMYAIGGKKLPPRREEESGIDPSALVDALERPARAVLESLPHRRSPSPRTTAEAAPRSNGSSG